MDQASGRFPRCGEVKGKQAKIEVQGEACMATNALKQNWVMVRVKKLQPPSSPDPNFSEFQGFMRLSDLAPRYPKTGVASLADDDKARTLYRAADPGCGAPTKGATPQDRELTDADRFTYDSGDGSVDADRNQSRAEIQRTGDPAERAAAEKCRLGAASPRICGAPYANYQGPGFAPYVALTTSSTAVTGSPFAYRQLGLGRGGLVRAIVKRSSLPKFRQYDKIGFVSGNDIVERLDPNVPCGQSAVANWLYGDANEGAAQDGDPETFAIFGWTPVRRPPQRGARQCGAPVLLAPPTVSGDPQVGPGDSEQGRLTAGEGRWTNAPDSYAYEWLRCPADNQTETLCSDTGQRGKTYQVTAADLGTPLGANVALRVRVTATVTGKGSNVAISAPTPPVHT